LRRQKFRADAVPPSTGKRTNARASSVLRSSIEDGCRPSGRPAAENGQADDAGTAVPDGPGGPSRAGGEIDGVEPRPRRRPGVLVPGRVGGDVEAAQGPEVDAQRPDGGELAVVRRVLQDEDVEVSVDVEELRIRRVGDVVRVRRGRHPGSLAGVDVPRPEGQRAVDGGRAAEHVDPY